MQLPEININGTDGKMLVAEANNAYHALNDAIVALTQMTVHGRDYVNINTATEEHRARIQALKTVRDEIMKINISILAQNQARTK